MTALVVERRISKALETVGNIVQRRVACPVPFKSLRKICDRIWRSIFGPDYGASVSTDTSSNGQTTGAAADVASADGGDGDGDGESDRRPLTQSSYLPRSFLSRIFATFRNGRAAQ